MNTRFREGSQDECHGASNTSLSGAPISRDVTLVLQVLASHFGPYSMKMKKIRDPERIFASFV